MMPGARAKNSTPELKIAHRKLPVGLYSLGRNDPKLFLQVKLVPRRSDRLVGPHRSQDGEFKSARRSRVPLAQFRKKGRRIGERQSRVMLDVFLQLAEPCFHKLAACQV